MNYPIYSFQINKLQTDYINNLCLFPEKIKVNEKKIWISLARAKAMASEPTNSNPNTELSEKPSKAKEEGELSSNNVDGNGDDNNNNDMLLSKTLAHIQTFS